MRYVLGLDGGGSKTECVVAREDGAIVGRARGGGVNRNFINAEGYERSVRDAVQGALDTAPEVRELAWVVGSMVCDGPAMRAIAQAYALDPAHMQWIGEALPARAPLPSRRCLHHPRSILRRQRRAACRCAPSPRPAIRCH